MLQEEVAAAQQDGSIARPTVQVATQPRYTAAGRSHELQLYIPGLTSLPQAESISSDTACYLGIYASARLTAGAAIPGGARHSRQPHAN